MFLANLTEEQKPAFLGLAYALIAADGILCREEISMMEQYAAEMALNANPTESQMPVEQAVAVFKVATIPIRKQVMFELVALAYADNDYATEEDCLLRETVGSLGLEPSFIDECRTQVEALTKLYAQIEKLVCE